MNESSDFLLFCEYDANPASLVAVKWRRNGKVIRVDRDERLDGGNAEQTALLVKNASRHDAGVYTCELANAIGNDTSDNEIFVDIHCECSDDLLLGQSEFISLLLGQELLKKELGRCLFE